MSDPIVEPTELLRPYLPRMLLQWLAESPGTILQQIDGTVVFVDISGFTKMSERLARKGKVGAEEVSEVLGAVFARMLAVAYGNGGGLIKFGGDALLLLFTGEDHPAKGARAAIGMRRTLREIGAIESSAGKIRLRMSVGVHSGTFLFFLVGSSHRELIITGPAASETVHMEGAAVAGEILVSRSTATALPTKVLGHPREDGVLLRSEPPGLVVEAVDAAAPAPEVDPTECLPVALRDHLLAGEAEPEHRQVTVAFIHFDGVDALVREQGPEAVAFGLDELVRDVQEAVDEHGVTFLGTDIDHDGGKIILTAGVPSALGDDEDRMLLALRRVIEGSRSIPIRIGVNKGPVFAGDIGPSYRRTYTVMGDAVNLAARVMAKAEPGQLLATGSVLDASVITFETTELEPFMVKGKRDPVRAFEVGRAVGSKQATGATYGLPLAGRMDELASFDAVLDRARTGHGGLLEIVGPPGIGKTRLLQALRDRAAGFSVVSSACELYEASTPYGPVRRILRGALEIPEDTADDKVSAMLRERVERVAPNLRPWLPLIAVPLDVEVDPTPEVDAIGTEFRRERLERVVSEFLARVFAETPTLLEIEDVHWMDEASASLLRRLARDVGAGPWVIALTRRDQETGFVGEDLADATALRPTPLGAAEAESLLLAATEAQPMLPGELATLVARSGGNPLFLLELLGAARVAGSVDELPTSVEGIVTAQIDRLPAADLRLLRFASVLGMSFTDDLMEAVLEGEQASLDPSAWQRLGEFVQETDPGVHRFRHGLMRDAAYEGLPFRRRRDLHARVGEAICRRAGADDEEFAEVLSMHFFHAQRFDDAWRFSRVAAERAASVYANLEARDFYLRALAAARRVPEIDPLDIAAIQEALGDVLGVVGEYRRAATAYSAALRLVRGDPLAEAHLLYRRSEIDDKLGRYSQALGWATQARRRLDGLESGEATAQRAQLSAWYATELVAQGRTGPAIRWARRSIEEADASGALDAKARALNVLDWAAWMIGAPTGESWRRALKIYEELGDLSGQARVLSNLAGPAFVSGRWDEAVEYLGRGREIARRIGDYVGAANDGLNIAEILSEQGRYGEAEEQLLEAAHVFRASESRHQLGIVLSFQGRIATRTGRFDEALATFDEARAALREGRAQSDAIELEGKVAEWLLFKGEVDEALRCASDALSQISSLEGGTIAASSLRRVIGYARMRAGDLIGARGSLQDSLRDAEEHGADFERALTLIALARLARIEGDTGQQELAESDAILLRLKVVAVPAFPLS